MKLKLDEHGHVVVTDGKPVYVHEDGKEAPFDAAHTLSTITRLNGEAKSHRERAEAAEGKFKPYEGIDDPDAARKALDTVKNLDQGQLVTAGRVEEIKAAAKKAAEEQVADAAKSSGLKIKGLEKQLGELTALYDNEKVTNAFAGSKFLKDKVAWPHDAVQAMFGGRFKREDGRLIGYDAAGNKIYSRTKPGEIADFDEAIEMTIDAYSHRDAMLKGTGSSGSGARPSNGGSNGQKTIHRSEFDRLPPPAQGAKIREGFTVQD